MEASVKDPILRDQYVRRCVDHVVRAPLSWNPRAWALAEPFAMSPDRDFSCSVIVRCEEDITHSVALATMHSKYGTAVSLTWMDYKEYQRQKVAWKAKACPKDTRTATNLIEKMLQKGQQPSDALMKRATSSFPMYFLLHNGV